MDTQYTLTVEARWDAAAEAPAVDTQGFRAPSDRAAVGTAAMLVDANFTDYGAVVVRWGLVAHDRGRRRPVFEVADPRGVDVG